MNHQQHLRKLLDKFLLIGIKTDQQMELLTGYMGNWIPEPEAPRIFQENDLSFSGNEKQLYSQSYFLLRDNTQTEYLKDKELNERLSDLVLEVIEDKDKFKTPTELNQKINEFLKDIIAPLKEYEILFKIRNMDANLKDEITIWDFKIVKYDKNSLISWGFQEEKRYLHKINDFKDQNLILVKEHGNNISEVIKRARIKANKRLRTLQTYLKDGYINDSQLRFELSEEYAIKEIPTNRVTGTGLNRFDSPLNYDYPEHIVEHAIKANEDYLLIKNFSPKIQDLLERTLYWIGLSISEIEIDVKIAFLCTALETLLTTQDDKRKGERLAYRGYLLAMEVGVDNHYIQPHEILRIYDLRSKIVHGSTFDEAKKEDYSYLLQFTKRTFKNFIVFAGKNSLNRQSKIYKKLLESKHIIPLLSWLDNFWMDELNKNKMAQFQKHSMDISNFLKEDWFKKN
jgi:hypothetical protein